jgi:hypothetical protein
VPPASPRFGTPGGVTPCLITPLFSLCPSDSSRRRWYAATKLPRLVDNSATILGQTDILVDSSDRPRVVYSAYGATTELRHATYDGVQWRIDLVDPDSHNLALEISLATDDADRLHMVCLKGRAIVYAVSRKDGWVFESIKTAPVSFWVGRLWQSRQAAMSMSPIPLRSIPPARPVGIWCATHGVTVERGRSKQWNAHRPSTTCTGSRLVSARMARHT